MQIENPEAGSPEGRDLDPSDTNESTLNHLQILVKGSALYISGDLATKLLAFILIPFYTRYLIPADYGIIEVIKAFTQVLTIVCGLGLNGALVRFYFEYSEPEDRARFFGTTVFALIGSAFLVILVFDLIGQIWFDHFFSGIPFHPYMRLAIWTVFLTSTSSIVLVLYRVRQEPGKYITFQLVQSFLGFALIIYFIVEWQNGALGKLQGEFVAAISVGILCVVLVRPYIRLYCSWPDVKKSLKFSVPLVPHLIFWWIMDLSDRMLLQYYTTLSEVGVYALGYNMASVMMVAIAGLNNAWAPYFFSMSNRPGAKDIIAKLLLYGLCVILFVGLVLVLVARELVLLITTPEYYEAYRVMQVIVLAFIFTGVSTILANLIFYGKTSHRLPLLTGLSACVNIGLNILLIPRFGMMGAAYATLIAMAVYACLVFIVSQDVYRVEYNGRKIGAMVVALILGLVIGSEIRLEGHELATIAIKASIPVAFIVFLWKFGIVQTEDLAIFGRKRNFRR